MQGPIRALEKEIEKVKGELMALASFRPGALSKQMNVCGKPGCACKADPPKKHGPYYQLSFSRKGKSSSRFIRRGEVKLVKQQTKDYARFKALMDRWLDLATRISELQVEELRRKSPKR